MPAEKEAEEERERAGLCADCEHAQRVVSDRSASFYLCQRSFGDSSFVKYPALPVRNCAGYEQVLS
jgi:hypothetical protein